MSTFDPNVWARVPFHFWTVVIFILGCMVGSFLNVCIHRVPRGESIVSPPSHCPHCNYAIPFYLNIPLITWLYLRGKCANCGAPIVIRYFLVELLTGVLFTLCWLKYGRFSVGLSLIYCVFMAGLIAASFIDQEHYIIPDGITIGGIVAGFMFSFFIPELHYTFPQMRFVTHPGVSLYHSAFGAAFGALIIYAVVRGGKLLFGRQKIDLEPGSKVIFTETELMFPGHKVEYGELFYRDTDTVRLQAKRLELVDRCYADATVRLQPKRLRIGEESFDPEQVVHMEAVTEQIVLPREAMGLGDVKFVGAMGAFLGWPAVVFILAASSFIGSVFGVAMIVLKKRERYGQIQFGPYLSMAAALWVLFGRDIVAWWLHTS